MCSYPKAISKQQIHKANKMVRSLLILLEINKSRPKTKKAETEITHNDHRHLYASYVVVIFNFRTHKRKISDTLVSVLLMLFDNILWYFFLMVILSQNILRNATAQKLKKRCWCLASSIWKPRYFPKGKLH